MFSFLKEIDNYLKSKQIPFKRIKINYSCFPPYINQAILNEMRKIVDDHFEFGDSTYELIYDNNGTLCLKVMDIVKRKILIIKEDDKKTNFDYLTFPCNESKIIKTACMLRYYHDYRNKIKRIIEKDYHDLPQIEKTKAEYYYMERVLAAHHKEYKKILGKVDYVTPLIDSVEKIVNYIEHLYSISKPKEKPKKTKEKEKNYGISYKEPEKEEITRSEPITLYGPSRERLNKIIATDLRFQVLEEFPYIYRDYAYNIYNKEINYMAYMYHINSHQYILIMEPYNGKKYTKIVRIIDDSAMTEEKFKNYVKHYLELSNTQCLVENGVIRISHTTLDMYKCKIGYAIAYLNSQRCSNYFKEKVKKLRER